MKNMNSRKVTLVLLSIILILCATIGGTLAWLTATSGPVVNTFTTSDITVHLQETTGTNYQMIPGHTIAKDPKAWVDTDSVPAYLFVKVEKSTNFNTYMEEPKIDTAWKKLDGVEGVYYCEVTNAAQMGESNAKPILVNNQLKVKESVTKEQMTEAKGNEPKLTFTAYAHQLYKSSGVKFTEAEAWNSLTTSANS